MDPGFYKQGQAHTNVSENTIEHSFLVLHTHGYNEMYLFYLH